MSYEIFVLNDDFSISRANYEECLDAIIGHHKELVPGVECPGGAESFTANDIEEKLYLALAFFDWRPFLTSDGIDGLQLDLPRVGGNEILHTVSPFVNEGSVIEYIGEDGAAVKYSFNGKIMNVSEGRITYEKKT